MPTTFTRQDARDQEGIRHRESVTAPAPYPLSLHGRLPGNGAPGREGVRASLQELAQLLSRRELTNAYEQVRDKLSDLETPAELLVFVVGEGNFGKPSLINRLLGRDVAEVCFLPKTWRVDLYRTALSGVPEHAQLRRAEQEQVERLSIAEAREACQAQEAMIKLREREAKAAGQEVPCGTFPGQIVEVQWHYRSARRRKLRVPPAHGGDSHERPMH